ncbi:hypothetical protein DUNSADRAFT_14249 [Dunaliella salina]|uniref:Encoded protein n=1 Tax=Dunaliella salina TaxID=3046 RepID=A0ABQ7G7P1_DUNSA|nr:hypothetical protein DUNSADRAFT_14249 [Dunaliella salina]|eukprot:KAF5830625.1 hypothetical protein DUNSADRAFT_14249 [Dunaliella salina]
MQAVASRCMRSTYFITYQYIQVFGDGLIFYNNAQERLPTKEGELSLVVAEADTPPGPQVLGLGLPVRFGLDRAMWAVPCWLC